MDFVQISLGFSTESTLQWHYTDSESLRPLDQIRLDLNKIILRIQILIKEGFSAFSFFLKQ